MSVRFISLCLLFVILFSSFSCVNNRTLKEFDLGNGRIIKVTTGVVDNGLPIYYEMHGNGKLIQKCFISVGSPDNHELEKLSFDISGDQSKNVFALIRKTPQTDTVAIVDFSDNFRYPCCGNDHGLKCKSRYNQLAEVLEDDNPGLIIERLRMENH